MINVRRRARCNFLIAIIPDVRTSGSRRDLHRSILMTPSLISSFLKKEKKSHRVNARYRFAGTRS